jgi:succinate dehydrogenase hydrophobic anchor subunit
MSGSKSGHSVAHQKIHTLTGWGVLFGFLGAVVSVLVAAPSGPQGIIDWLSTPIGAVGFLAFFTAAVWYCKLEMDEVIVDYFGGKMRAFGLLKNKFVAVILWAAVAFAVIKLAFLG